MLRHFQPVGIALMILTGCAHLPPSGKAAADSADSAPDWLLKLPREGGSVYAVGIAGPTFYPDDGVRNAGDNGRVELAHVISSKITAATLTVNTTRGSYSDTASVVDATHDYTDTIVQFAEVVSTWIDQSGTHSSGQRGTAYALVRLNLREAGIAPSSSAAAQ